MSGPELQRKLIASQHSIPIVFITAHGDEAVRERVLEEGAVDCLLKPFTEDALLNAVNAALRELEQNPTVFPKRSEKRCANHASPDKAMEHDRSISVSQLNSANEKTPMKKIVPPVCVVDDDPGVREAVENLLRSEGFEVETFASAQRFMARARMEPPACLVLDVNLPGLSGLDLQRELVDAGIPIPIIFLTGHGSIPMSVRAMKAGEMEFLTKPFNADDLLSAIQEGISGRIPRS